MEQIRAPPCSDAIKHHQLNSMQGEDASSCRDAVSPWKGQGWKYPDGDLCLRWFGHQGDDGVDIGGQHAGMALGDVETAATGRGWWTPDLGQVAGTGRGFLEAARPPVRGRPEHRGRGRRGHRGRGQVRGLVAALITDVLFIFLLER